MEKPADIFLGPSELEAWLDNVAWKILGMSGADFVKAYEGGRFVGDGAASDLAAVIPLIRKRPRIPRPERA